MTTISKKMKWVASDGWRGREVPVNAICGANDTGTWSDSPCNSNVRKSEISMAKTALRKTGIKHITAWGKSSNVFCVAQYVLVAPEDREKAVEAIKPLIPDTSLLYLCN